MTTHKNGTSVDHPPHYNRHPSGVECIEVVRHMGFNVGNAVKYLWRAGLKPTADLIEDIEKARYYLADEIVRLGGEVLVEAEIVNTETETAQWAEAANDMFAQCVTLGDVVFQAIGAGSMCWSTKPTGIFESTRASAIGEQAQYRIRELVDTAREMAGAEVTRQRDRAEHVAGERGERIDRLEKTAAELTAQCDQFRKERDEARQFGELLNNRVAGAHRQVLPWTVGGRDPMMDRVISLDREVDALDRELAETRRYRDEARRVAEEWAPAAVRLPWGPTGIPQEAEPVTARPALGHSDRCQVADGHGCRCSLARGHGGPHTAPGVGDFNPEQVEVITGSEPAVAEDLAEVAVDALREARTERHAREAAEAELAEVDAARAPVSQANDYSSGNPFLAGISLA